MVTQARHQNRRTQRGTIVTHRFRKRLTNGELLVGTMVTLSCPTVAEILALIGFDWLFLDAEHSTFEARTMQTLLQGAGADTPCLVRVSSSEEVPIKKALDVGAAGIIAPQVNSVEAAEGVVRFSKYSPEGARGVGIGRAHSYGLTFQEYVDAANQNVAVIVQAEHIKAVACWSARTTSRLVWGKSDRLTILKSSALSTTSPKPVVIPAFGLGSLVHLPTR